MKEEYRVSGANLASSHERIERDITKIIAHIGETAYSLCCDAGEDVIFFRDKNFIEEYRKVTGRLLAGKRQMPLDVYERALLCERIAVSMGIVGLRGAETFFDENYLPVSPMVCYFRTPYTDDAYMKFSELSDDFRVSYSASFAESCENVYNDRCGFCILPIENTTDGVLSGFRSLAVKHGLKTVAVCKIKTNPDEITTFALMSREIIVPRDKKTVTAEVRIGLDAFPDLVSASEVFGGRIVAVNTTSGGRSCDIRLELDGERLCGFITYVFLETGENRITGLY